MAVRYPLERILQEYRAYFTNHCAYMIALAMTEGVDTIGLWGCQYGASSEYSAQRGSLEYWLGRFEQAGGNVILPVKGNTVLHDPAELYGYESHDEQGHLVKSYQPKFAHLRDKKKGVDLIIQAADDLTRPELAPLPDGETAIAWDRRAELFNLPTQGVQ